MLLSKNTHFSVTRGVYAKDSYLQHVRAIPANNFCCNSIRIGLHSSYKGPGPSLLLSRQEPAAALLFTVSSRLLQAPRHRWREVV